MSSNAIETPPLAAQLESLSALIRRTEPFCQRISAVGMYIFMGLVILTFADVLLRYVIGSPISGSIEITEMLMSVVLFSSVYLLEARARQHGHRDRQAERTQ